VIYARRDSLDAIAAREIHSPLYLKAQMAVKWLLYTQLRNPMYLFTIMGVSALD